jgi:GDP-4-dehydro-6-deoxy-D-mannose reductase
MSRKGRILVTGASGFVGQHAMHGLVEAGFEVVALDNNPAVLVPAGVEVVQASLMDPASFATLPREWLGVIHLAAISVPGLFSTPAPVLANLQMTMNLLEHLSSARVVIVSSCHVYAPGGEPLREEDAISPQGRYGLSKHLCEQLLSHYLGKLDLRIARPFNHIGPGMPPSLMIPTLLRRIGDRAKGDHYPLVMKGTNSIRDFIDVRDVVSAYMAIINTNSPQERIFNVCTGRPVAIRELASEALRLAGLECPVEFQAMPSSSDDIPYIVGNPDRLDHECGWTASYSLTDSLQHLLTTPHA